MALPYRQNQPISHADTMARSWNFMQTDGDAFRRAHPASFTELDTQDGDPRLTPAGDIARRGTIPGYVPMAVINPGRLTTLPQ